MIHLDSNIFAPGSEIPVNLVSPDFSDTPLVEEYLLSAGWERGVGLLLLGPSGSGKTTLGMAVLKAIHSLYPVEMIYWNEHDFLADLRNLWRMEDMTQKFARDDVLWAEYMDWERTFWTMKTAPFLFFDHACRGYTPMHNYEVENMLRLRESQSLPTIVASQDGLWDNAPFGLTSVIERNSLKIRLKGR